MLTEQNMWKINWTEAECIQLQGKLQASEMLTGIFNENWTNLVVQPTYWTKQSVVCLSESFGKKKKKGKNMMKTYLFL